MLYEAATLDITQKVAKTLRVRFKVTVCWYFSPNNNTRSLSTLIAATVDKDTPLKP